MLGQYLLWITASLTCCAMQPEIHRSITPFMTLFIYSATPHELCRDFAVPRDRHTST